MTDKVKAIVAHLWVLGWLIALIMNSKEKGELTRFYLRQTLGIYLIGIAGSILAFFSLGIINWVISIVVFLLWIVSLINAIGEKKAPVPVVGQFFQDKFKSI